MQSELCDVRGEVERERERVKELEMTLQDKEEMVRIVEKKSNGLVRIMFDGVCVYVFVLASIHSSQLYCIYY